MRPHPRPSPGRDKRPEVTPNMLGPGRFGELTVALSGEDCYIQHQGINGRFYQSPEGTGAHMEPLKAPPRPGSNAVVWMSWDDVVILEVSKPGESIRVCMGREQLGDLCRDVEWAINKLSKVGHERQG